ncbi:ABC transporter permease [Microbacterium forte]|uniref:ABC transporter permease n=1 Tax=Microbacterium forte TaxID=2982533 RepID=UPI002892D9B4|nr:ABC transporter permease [Microbacterium sp. A(2022)]
MARATLVRILRALATVLIVATIVFVIIRLTGDPIRSVVPEGSPPEIEALYRQRWGLDKPIWEQYLVYLAGIARGDFGQSYFDSAPALDVVAARIPATLQLTVPAFIVSTSVGLSVGVFAALHRGKWLDRVLSSTSVILGAIPSFALGVVLVLVFAVTLRWLPSAGNTTPMHLVMPLIAMALAPAALLARMTRASMSDALSLPSIEHAASLGLPRWKQVLQYALPNAFLPLITILGFDIAYLLAGSSVVEVLFSWPGIGRLFVQAAGQRDFAVVQCVVLLVTVSVVLVNLLTDMSYKIADPRLRRSKA